MDKTTRRGNMSFLTALQADQLRDKLVTDLSLLGKIYKAKKNEYLLKSVDHSLVDEMLKEGWEEYSTPLKTKTKLRKHKKHDIKFEDDIWCQLYELGYRCLNYDNNFRLPYGKTSRDTKQIDVVAVDDDSILLIECKSSENTKKAPSFKTELEGRVLPRFHGRLS
ncbi:MAG: nuclease-related domain-containing protein [Candidatus Thiodiazotropha endolucinida]